MVEERLREHSERIGTLESTVSDVRVQTTKILTKQEAMDGRVDALHVTLATSMEAISKGQEATRTELIELLKAQLAAKHEEASTTRQADRAAAEAKSKWLRDVMNPQTILLMLTILAGAFGISQSQQPVATIPPEAMPSVVNALEVHPRPATDAGGASLAAPPLMGE